MANNTQGYFSPSRLFIYYNARVMINTVKEDSGSVIRDAIKSLNKQGVPKESTWPYKYITNTDLATDFWTITMME